MIAEGEKLVHLRGKAQRQWVIGLLDTGKRSGAVAVGFKTKLKDVDDHREFTELIREHEFRIILMTRRNTLKLAISTLNARRLFEHRGQWNLQQGDAGLPPMRLERTPLMACIETCEAKEAELRSFVANLNLPQLVLDYDDLRGHPEQEMNRVLQFLEAPSLPLQSDVKKNTSDNLSEAIENFDEVEHWLRGTPYEGMIGNT